MRIFRYALPVLILSATAMAANADDGRFTLEKVTGGYVRLNTVTGEVSFCEQKAGQFVCRISPSERAAYEDQIRALQDRLDQVEERIAILEGREPEPGQRLTTEEEFEQTLGFMEKFFRRFMGIVKDFEQEFDDEEEAETLPEKT